MTKRHFHSLAAISLMAVCGAAVGQETNVDALNRISNQARIQAQADKQDALRLAPLYGLPVRGQFPNGGIYELVAIRNGKPLYFATDNADAAISTEANRIYPGGSLGLSVIGSGVVLGEWDGGNARTTHQELTGRVTIGDAGEAANVNHATHVAGTLIASGVQAAAKGMSYGATLKSFGWTNDVSEMAAQGAAGLRLSNSSYGFITGWNPNTYWYWYGDLGISTTQDFGFGFYDTTAAQFDNVCYNAPYFLPVKSAGNDRNQGPASQPFGHYDWNGSSWVVDSTGSHNLDGNGTGYDSLPYNATAKNMLIVGAVNDVPSYTGPASVTMSTFSSWGPTDDGRIKPDVVGNGVGLYSSVGTSNTAYDTYSGTSMASPNVAGTLGLWLKRWRDTHRGSDPRASTMKALAIHSAKECGSNPGPDYAFGFGLISTVAANSIITADVTKTYTITENRLDNGKPHVFYVHSAGAAFKATMAWTDKPGPVSPESLNPTTLRLVNDLDMRVLGPLGGVMATNRPWVLNPASPSAAATTGDNFRDNVEQISKTLGAGWYKITISHKGTLSSPASQYYSLILTGIDNLVSLKSVTLSPTSVVGCFDIAGTVSLTTGAPTGGLVVPLVSSSTKATVPSSVTVPAGATSANFTVKTSAVTSNTNVTITANLLPSSKYGKATLTPGGMSAFTLPVKSIKGGSSLNGTVTISAAAPAGGTVIAISDNSSKVGTPASTTVAAGTTSKSFTITTQAVVSNTLTTITATMGGKSITRSLTLTP